MTDEPRFKTGDRVRLTNVEAPTYGVVIDLGPNGYTVQPDEGDLIACPDADLEPSDEPETDVQDELAAEAERRGYGK